MTVARSEAARGAEAWNMRLVGHCDMDGTGDGMHINLKDGYAFFAHMGDRGTSILDVRDPSAPRLVTRIPAPPDTHSHKVQIVGDVLLVNREKLPRSTATSWTAGLSIYDISNPESPREIGFWPCSGRGVHRMTWWEAPYAYVSATAEGYSDQILIILDLSNPSAPREVGRWWMPGMQVGAGETPLWPPDWIVKLHHAIPRGNRAYCGWWDYGLVVLDTSDKAAPRLVSHLPFGHDESRSTHTACPLPGRDLLVVTDECNVEDCQGIQYQVRLVDIADERHPRVVSKFPVPEGDFCQRGGRFGPHNVHEMRPGTLQDPNTVYLTYFNAGVRVVDVSDPANPTEIAYYIPEAPPGRRSIQMNDIIVGPDGLIYASDRYQGGLYIFELTAGARAARPAARR